MSRAVLYLRVSSRGQLTDYDEDGLSIAGQREQCARKARDLDAEIITEYVERAESAKSDDRPALRQMLARIRDEHDVDYVIVWKVDRFARNRRDDANMLFEIEMAGTKLISATENIDGTPAGRLMHGMLASFSEYYSRNLAAEVVKGATQKAKRGGTPGLAPLGYVNVIERVEGRDVRTVGVDPERAPLVRWAFETYATGHYSLNDLVSLLEARGLRSRGNRRYTPRPLNHASIYGLLTNDYYAGIVTYRGAKYPGRHEPLIGRQTFDHVQAVAKAHNISGERDRQRPHYLKGTLYCGGCGRRLTYSENKGNGGTYAYFVCPMKQRGHCREGYKRADRTEAMLERYYARVVVTPERQARLRELIRAEADRMTETSQKERTRCNNVLATLKEQERKLLQAHYQDRVSDDLYNEEAARITREREQVEQIAARLEVQFSDVQRNLDLALELLGDIQRAFIVSPPHVRRLINQAIFVKIELWDIDEIQGHVAEPFSALVDGRLFETRWAESWKPGPQTVPERSLKAARKDESPDLWEIGASSDLGSIRSEVVGTAGFEPATSRV